MALLTNNMVLVGDILRDSTRQTNSATRQKTPTVGETLETRPEVLRQPTDGLMRDEILMSGLFLAGRLARDGSVSRDRVGRRHPSVTEL